MKQRIILKCGSGILALEIIVREFGPTLKGLGQVLALKYCKLRYYYSAII